MARAPGEVGLKRGAWSPEEDRKLMAYIERYRIWNWNHMANFAGLSRSGKSCRLRWMNYLRPNIKHGNMSREEEEIILKMQRELGNRWSIIASKLPGRTDNEIKNYWNARFKKHTEQKLSKVGSNKTFTSLPENSDDHISLPAAKTRDSWNSIESSIGDHRVETETLASAESEKIIDPFEWFIELGSLWEEPVQVKNSEELHIHDPMYLCAFFDGEVIW